MTEPTSEEKTPLYRTIERRLEVKGIGLVDIVNERRRYYTWRAIARELSDLADAEVSYEFLRRWFGPKDSTDDAPEDAA